METVRKECLDLKLLPETSAVKFNGPKKIAYFSTYFDKENKEVYCPDNSSQRYLVSTALKERINCLEGFNPESNKWLPPDPKWQWRNFMRWIGDNDEIIQSLTPQNDSQQQIDFICTNVELKQIMLSLYQTYDWIIHAFRIKSEIFLCFTKDGLGSKQPDSEQSSSEKPSSEQTSSEKPSSEQSSSEKPSSEQTSSEKPSSEQTSSEKPSSEQSSSEKPSSEQTSSEKPSSEQSSSEKPSSEQTSSEQTSSEQTSSEQASSKPLGPYSKAIRVKKGFKSPYNPKKTKMLRYSRLNVIRKITKPVKEREFNSNSETDFFNIISFSKIGQHRILYTCLTEFVMSKDDIDKPNNQASFAALKLMHNLFKGRNGGFNIPFYRSMFWWASALVSGVETLICGDLDNNYSVKKFKVIPPSNLDTKHHKEAQKKCLITLDKILHFIKSEVQEKNKVYEFRLDAETKEVVVSPSEKPIEAFVPPWNASEDIPEQAKS